MLHYDVNDGNKWAAVFIVSWRPSNVHNADELYEGGEGIGR